MGAMKIKYGKYPDFVEANRNRHLGYNSSLALIKREEQSGSVVAVRPKIRLKSAALKRTGTSF